MSSNKISEVFKICYQIKGIFTIVGSQFHNYTAADGKDISPAPFLRDTVKTDIAITHFLVLRLPFTGAELSDHGLPGRGRFGGKRFPESQRTRGSAIPGG